MKAFRMPLVLLSLLIILAALAYWDEQKTHLEAEYSKNQKKFFTADISEVENLTLLRPKAVVPVIKFLRKDDLWHIVAPVQEIADQDAVVELLNSLLEYSYERDLGSKKESLNKYGFEEAEGNNLVTMRTVSGEETGIEVGSKTPTGFSLYLRYLEGEKVFIGSQLISDFLSKKLFNFRRQSLDIPSIRDIKEISFIDSINQVKLNFRQVANVWHLSEKKRPLLKIDQASIVDMMSVLRAAVILQYIDKPSNALKKALAKNNSGTVEIGMLKLFQANDLISSYRFVENNEQIYLIIGEGDQYLVFDKGIKAIFEKTKMDFLNRDVFDFDDSIVSAFSLNNQTYKNEGGEWNREGKSAPSFSAFLSWLGRLRASQLVGESDMADKVDLASKPRFDGVISLQKNIEIRFKIWQGKDLDQFYLKKDSEPNLYQLSSDMLDKFDQLTDFEESKPNKS